MGAGYLININDIAGPYSGIIFGISNTMATLTGIISPFIASTITKHVNDLISKCVSYFLIIIVLMMLLKGISKRVAKSVHHSCRDLVHRRHLQRGSLGRANPTVGENRRELKEQEHWTRRLVNSNKSKHR